MSSFAEVHLNDMESAPSRARTVAAAIEKLIFAGELLPGDRIGEVAMAERFGVSRGPIREACRELAAKGLISLSPRQGAFVRSLNFKEIVDIFDIRAALGRLAGVQAANSIDTPDLDLMEHLIEAMDKKVEQGDSVGYTHLNLEFHDILYRIAGNERLRMLDRRLGGELRIYRQRGVAFGGLAVSNQEHRELMDSLRRGDARAAGERLERHIANGRDRFIRASVSRGSVSADRALDKAAIQRKATRRA
jgi:DNA-binding GntR family transcriptional regulator